MVRYNDPAVGALRFACITHLVDQLELHTDLLVALATCTMLSGFDYKGEPVPNTWPDVNSHFGFLDIAGFLKERGHWQVHQA